MMPRPKTLLLLLLPIFTVFAASLSISESIGDGSQVYVVYLGHLPGITDASEPEGFSDVEFAHHDLLNQVLDDGSSASDRILRSYKRSLNGFAAKLSKEEAHKLSGMNGVVSVFPSRTLSLLTTRSWDFLGFPEASIEQLPLEGDIIIGVLDSGIWPDSPSFSDEGFGAPPSRWKGTCQNFTCNNKIIGARAYDGEGGSSSSGLSPLDDDGHGSHTASIAAGRAVANVSLDGLAAGTARGAVPGARLAIYKVCQRGSCSDADILAGFDDAIADGVDVISISIGNSFGADDYFSDAIAIGSFHAMRRGVLTSAAAGNSGLEFGYVENVAPWMLSVAASSIDRRFIDKIVPGNGKTIVGASINTFPTVTNATLAFPPNGNPVGTIHRAETRGNPEAPEAASFSSPGPNPITPDILKPDLSAPGVDIIASWSPVASPSGIANDTRKFQYNIISGTSMACPHASGAAAYIKSLHHDWSPAMIMSALITTATSMVTPANSDTSPLKYGAGQLNPVKAHDPGLVYDASESDYVAMLCAQGYNATQLALITSSNTTACNNGSTSSSPRDLNYPTMAASVEPGKNFTVVFPRTVTNVGAASTVYDLRFDFPYYQAENVLTAEVSPSELEFSELNQKVSFTVTVSGMPPEEGKVYSFNVVWYNNEHEVTSPVVVYTSGKRGI